MEVVRGISFTVARVWDGVTREFERRLKNSGGMSRYCPVCKAEGAIPKSRQRTRAEVPVAPPAPSTGPDYAEVEERVGEEFGKRSSASRRLPKGVRVTVKRERLPGGADLYIGHIWRDYQYAGHCPVYSELPSKAREAAIDWAWQMFPEPGGAKTAGSAELEPVGIGSLPQGTQEDIAYALFHGSGFLSRSGYDEADILANLSGLSDEPMVLSGPASVDSLYRTMRPRGISEAAVKKYTERLASDPGFEFDPVITVGGRLYEGGHRLEAYHRAGRGTIPIVEIANLMYAPDDAWRRWMEGDSSVTAEQAFPVMAGKVAYDYKQMFRTILSELEALDPLAAHKAGGEINAWINWGKRVLQKRDRIAWFLRLGQLKWAEYLADAYQQYKSPGSRAAEAGRWREWIKAKAQQEDPPSTPEGAVSTNMGFTANMLEHYLSLPIPEIQGTVFLRQQPGEILDGFRRLEKEWRDRQSRLLQPHEGDRAVIEFPDGWAWWLLDRSYCPDEAKAMGHCGNEAAGPGRPDDRILSLRRKVAVRGVGYLEPHLTFILDERGLLGEMKGRGNEKPAPRYHPYIARLLEQKDLVRGIKGGGYLPEHNFSLDDLPPEEKERAKEANRGLVSASEMYSESRGNMTDELLQRITERTVLRRDQWRPELEAFVVDEYANTEWFISTEGSKWLKAQMMLARGGFGKYPNHQVVEEGIRDLLSVLDDSERRAVIGRMPPIPGPPLVSRVPSPDAPWRNKDLPSLFMEERNDHALWSYLRGATRILSAPEQQGEYERLWGVLAAAWEAGVTKEMRQAALDRVRHFLGNSKWNHVRTNDASRVVFPDEGDPDFWGKPVLVEVSIQDAVHLASPFSYEETGYSGGEDTKVFIDDYWETGYSRGLSLYDASEPYKRLTLPSDQKRDLDLKMDLESAGKEGRSVRQWHEAFLGGRPYEYLRWLREEIPGIFEQEMTPGAWDEEKARKALMAMLPSIPSQAGRG
jgi:hypothetical protein